MADKNTKIRTVTIDNLPEYEGNMGVNDENDFLPIYDVINDEDVSKSGGTRRLTVKKLKELMMAMNAQYMNKIARTAFESLSGFKAEEPEPPVNNTAAATGSGSKNGTADPAIPVPDLAVMLNAAYNYIKTNVYDIKGSEMETKTPLDALKDGYAAALQKTIAEGILNLDDEAFMLLNYGLLAPKRADKSDPDNIKCKGAFYKTDAGAETLPRGGLDLDSEDVWNYNGGEWSKKTLAYYGKQGENLVYPQNNDTYRTLHGIEIPYGSVISPSLAASKCVAYIKDDPSWDIYSKATVWKDDPEAAVATAKMKFDGLRVDLNIEHMSPNSAELVYVPEDDSSSMPEATFDLMSTEATIPCFVAPDTPGVKQLDTLFQKIPPRELLGGTLPQVNPMVLYKCVYPKPDHKYELVVDPGTGSERKVCFYFQSGVSNNGVEEYIISQGAVFKDGWTLDTESGEMWKYTPGDPTTGFAIFWSDETRMSETFPELGEWSMRAWVKPSPGDSYPPFYTTFEGDPESGYEKVGIYTLREARKSKDSENAWVFKYKLYQSDPEVIEEVAEYTTDGRRPQESNVEHPVYSGAEGADMRGIVWHGWEYINDSAVINCESVTDGVNTVWQGNVVHYNAEPYSLPGCLALPNAYPQPEPAATSGDTGSDPAPQQRYLIDQIIAENRVVATVEDMKQLKVATYLYDPNPLDNAELNKEFYHSQFTELNSKEFCAGLFEVIKQAIISKLGS